MTVIGPGISTGVMVALAITSCLMAWGVIVAIDRLIYADWDKAAGTQRVQPLKFERTD